MGRAVRRMKIQIRVPSVILLAGLALAAPAAAQQDPWQRPSAEIAHRIAEVLGSAPAHVTWSNLSSLPSDALPAIRRAVERDLAADGVHPSASDAATQVHITLSQDARGGLWVAEIQQGTEARVLMVTAEAAADPHPQPKQTVALQRRRIAWSSELPWKEDAGNRAVPQILAASEMNGQLLVLTPARIAVFGGSPAGWSELQSAELGTANVASRDPRGVLAVTAGGFTAAAPGAACSAAPAASSPPGWTLECRSSDDPWPIAQNLKAFYNGARNYFTGVVAPALGVDLPPFFSAAFVSGRGPSPELLVGGIDGNVRLLEGGALNPVSGTRDWGSDFASIASGCGSGSQVLVPSSGDGPTDTLRAWEIAGQDAQPVSEPLALQGAVMSLATAADGKSAIAIIRIPLADGQHFDYEVDRVTATCD